ncbi:MAG: LacI family transcriptional regulator [Bacteroidetes bacterium]|nr:LacI family transcriptional regulator [Bacteroidota bacterium]
MKKVQATTLRDIARTLNVSISTVSRALQGYAEVNEETRKAVRAVAAQMDYAPNQIAQNLRANKTKLLGIVVPELATHFFSATLSGFQDVAAEQGYNVMICQSKESYQGEVRNIQTLMSSRVDGLIISLSKETTDYSHLQALRSRGVPLVLFDRVSSKIDTTSIMVDEHDGAFKATEHLIEAGCRRIAHLSGPENLSISRNRLQGYLDALQQNNMPVQEELVRHCSLSEADVIAHAKTLLDLPQPPDAIFAINDPAAIQVIQIIKERGLKIPEDIAVVGFNNEPITALLEPGLTTIAQPALQMGQLAARHILEQLEHPDSFIPQNIVLKTRLVIRGSSQKHRQTVAD